MDKWKKIRFGVFSSNANMVILIENACLVDAVTETGLLWYNGEIKDLEIFIKAHTIWHLVFKVKEAINSNDWIFQCKYLENFHTKSNSLRDAFNSFMTEFPII